MTIYDVVMISMVVAGMIWGLMRGFSWQMASIGALLVGYLGSHQSSTYILPFLALYLPGDAAFQRGASMLLTFVVISGLIFVAIWAARGTLKKMKFEAYDRHLGFLLGGLEGALLGLIGTMFVVSLSSKAREPIFTSRAGHVVARVMDLSGPVLPCEVRKEITPFWNGAPASVAPEPVIANDSAPKTLVETLPETPPLAQDLVQTQEPVQTQESVQKPRPWTGRTAGASPKIAVERLGENSDEASFKRQ